MTPIDFSNLEKHSKIINEGSDRVSQALLEIQEKLNPLNLGVEVWLDWPTAYLSEKLAEEGWSEVNILGYGKNFDGKWGLLVKESRVRGSEDEFEEDVMDTGSLLDASRNLRIKALDQVPRLIRKIESRASGLAETVVKAKESADKL